MSTTHYYWGFPNAPVPVLSNAFFGAPVITSFTASAPVGTAVTITGINFTGATAVTFNGTTASFTVLNSQQQINTTVPVGATTGTIVVTTPVGTATSAASFTVTTAAAKPKALFFQDDSLGAYYYAADGTWTHPSTKVTGTPNPQTFAGKLAALVQGGVPVFNNSYPGFNIVDAGTNGPAPSYSGYNVVADANAIFAANTAYDIDMVAGFLENGFDLHTLAQIKTAWDSYNTMYLGIGAKRIFHRVPVQRTGAYSNTVDGTYSANILSMRTYMRSQAAASGGTIIIANDADGPNITAQGYPANVQYCNQNDVSNGTPLQVHFTEYGVTEQANEIRLLLAANGYAFSGPAVSVGTGGVTTATPPASPNGTPAAFTTPNASVTISGNQVTAGQIFGSFTGIANSTAKLSGLGVLRWVLVNDLGASLVGIAKSRTVNGPFSELAAAVYFDMAFALNSYVAGALITSGVQNPTVGTAITFTLTAHPTNATLYQCQIAVNGTNRDGLIDIPAGQYFLSTALGGSAPLAIVAGYLVSGATVANP